MVSSDSVLLDGVGEHVGVIWVVGMVRVVGLVGMVGVVGGFGVVPSSGNISIAEFGGEPLSVLR